MFDIAKCKRMARRQLKGRWKTPLLSSLVMLGIVGMLQFPRTLATAQGAASMQPAAPSGTSSVTFIITCFILGVLNIAHARLYLELSRSPAQVSFSGYLKGFTLWLPGFFGFLWQFFWTLLWTLLFVIPGIVKMVAYSQMFFLLAEYPDIGARKAMRISKVLTRGYKADIFCLYLSFLPWFLLSALTGGILLLWLVPYMSMAFANAYQALKLRALETNELKPADFESGW